MKVMHMEGLLHRDIKPENFLIGNAKSELNVIYAIDFGLSKSFRDRLGKHIEFKEKKGLIGTARYASIHTHNGIE